MGTTKILADFWEDVESPEGEEQELDLSSRYASKIDYLERQKGFAQTPEGKAGIHMLKTRYPEQGDAVFPLMFREWKKGWESQTRGDERPQGLHVSPMYLDHYKRYLSAVENDHHSEADYYRDLLNGDRPDAYFFAPKEEGAMDGENVDPIQPGMVQNVGKMLEGMKQKNAPRPDMLSKDLTLDQLHQMVEQWKSSSPERDQNLGSVVHEFPDGWSMRELKTPEECYDEGEEMGHCGSKYAPLVKTPYHQVFSLRDPQNYPHASVAYRPQEHTIEDVIGKANQPLSSKYLPYLHQFFPTLGEGLTISGHGDPRAPAIPGVNAYGLPVVGAEAAKQQYLLERQQAPLPEYEEEPALGPHEGGFQRQAWIFIADKLYDYLRGGKLKTDNRGLPYFDEKGNPQFESFHRPEFGDPSHPDHERNNEFLNHLEDEYHSDATDELFPWLAGEYLKGRMRHFYDERAGAHRIMRARPEHEIHDEVEQLRDYYKERGYTTKEIEEVLQGRAGPTAWKSLDHDEVEQIGDWLHNTNSQNPTRAGFNIHNAEWEDMLKRTEDFKEWRRRKESIKNAIFKSKDGKMHVVALEPKDAQWEGETMQNCIHGYGPQLSSKETQIYSLRDKGGSPKVDMEVRPGIFYNPKTKESMAPSEYREAKNGKRVDCPDCQGTGRPPENAPTPACPACGSDNIEDYPGEEQYYWRCRDCRREINKGRCPKCQGYGYIQEPARDDIEDFVPSPFGGQVVQIQGKQNRPPDEKYHPYVKEFFGRIPDDKKPQWSLPKTHFTRMGQLFDPVEGHIVYYHPGDYGLPNPNVTTDWPSLMRSYADSGQEMHPHYSEDEKAQIENNNRMRARYVYHWGLYGGQADEMHAALTDPELTGSIKRKLGEGSNVRDLPEMQQWIQENPAPAEHNIEPPTGMDEEGNDTYNTPEYAAQLAEFQKANEAHWLAREAYQSKYEEMVNSLREKAGEYAWNESPQKTMFDHLHNFISGNAPEIREFEDMPDDGHHDEDEEDMEHEGSVRVPVSRWCYCGKCEDDWEDVTFRFANAQAYNRVRNMLRRNGQLTYANEIALTALQHHYPDHGNLAEFLHREFRKGRFRPEYTAEYNLKDIKRYEDIVKGYDDRLQEYRDQNPEHAEADEDALNAHPDVPYSIKDTIYDARAKRARIDRLKQGVSDSILKSPFWYTHEEDGSQHTMTPEEMTDFVDHLKKRGQREKGFNIMQHEISPLATEAHKEAQTGRMLANAGRIVHEYGPPHEGWTMRYLDTPESASTESEIMGHCVRYYRDHIVGGRTHNYSLRDEKGFPHVTFELVPKDEKNQIDWEKLRNEHAASPEEFEKMKAVYDRWSNKTSNPPYVHQMQPDRLPDDHYTRGQTDEGEEGTSLYEWLRAAHAKGLIGMPDIRNSNLRQIAGRSGSASAEKYADLVKEWMQTIPIEDRPTNNDRYYGGDTTIDHVKDMMGEREPSTDKYGFVVPGGRTTVDWPSVVNTLHDEQGNYDPALGMTAYQWAKDNGGDNHYNLYRALNGWEKKVTPKCPSCGVADDVQQVQPNAQGHNFKCTYDNHTWQKDVPEIRTGPPYSPYQAAAVSHIGSLLSDDPEAAHYLGSNRAQHKALRSKRPYQLHLNDKGALCICQWADARPQHHIAAWHEGDADWAEDADSGQATQPDHYPNAARENQHIYDDEAECPICGDSLVDGDCLRCQWGGWQNASQPVKNFPLDPFRDDNAGIRASLGRTIPEHRWSLSSLHE